MAERDSQVIIFALRLGACSGLALRGPFGKMSELPAQAHHQSSALLVFRREARDYWFQETDGWCGSSYNLRCLNLADDSTANLRIQDSTSSRDQIRWGYGVYVGPAAGNLWRDYRIRG